MTQTCFVPGPLPGLNEMLAAAKSGHGKGNAYARLKSKWGNAIALHIRKARLKPMSPPVHLHFDWWEPNKRRDHDNVAAGKKLVLDALVATKIIPGDGWAYVTGWSDAFTHSTIAAGVNVTIYEAVGDDR